MEMDVKLTLSGGSESCLEVDEIEIRYPGGKYVIMDDCGRLIVKLHFNEDEWTSIRIPERNTLVIG